MNYLYSRRQLVCSVAAIFRGRKKKEAVELRTFPAKMPAYTIPAGSNYTITQFVRSRAIKSLAFMADATEKLRDPSAPSGPLPDF